MIRIFCLLYFWSAGVALVNLGNRALRSVQHLHVERRARLIFKLSGRGSDNVNEEKEDRISKALWAPEAVSSYLSRFNLPNIIFGSFLGAIFVLLGLFGPIFFDNGGDFLPDGSVVVKDDALKPSETKRSDKSSREAMTKAVTLFSDVLTNLRNGYVDELDQNTLFETAINAMLKSLDPYTEFENFKQSKAVQESVQGRYGGVGLVIANQQEIVTKAAARSNIDLKNKGQKNDRSKSSSRSSAGDSSDISIDGKVNDKSKTKNKNNIVVVDAFEGYSYESGMRVGDRILSVGGTDVSSLRIDDVRDLLRGEPDTEVIVTYERDGMEGVQIANLKRQAIRLSDVRLATFLGNPEDRIGYISLSGFNAGAAKDFRTAYLVLKYSAMMMEEGLITPDGHMTQKALDEVQTVRDNMQGDSLKEDYKHKVSTDSSGSGDSTAKRTKSGNDEDTNAHSTAQESTSPGLKGLVLDLRGNPGGLLDAAVEIASYLVPQDSEIVSARSRSGPSIVYKSSAEPIRDSRTKLVVLVNRGSASASEIVSGAIQDLDAGVIVGESRTYGKGLVQKIVPLPYDSALKYTIAKYYTPSGRCIQAVNYAGGRGDEEALAEAERSLVEEDGEEPGDRTVQDGQPDEDDEKGSFLLRSPGALQDKLDGASFIREEDRKTFYTANGRPVRDAGGIEPDIQVSENELTPIEKIFVTKDVYNKFAKQYLKSHDVLTTAVRPSVMEERAMRDADARYMGGRYPNGATIRGWLVLQNPENGPVRSYLNSKNRIAFGKITHDQLYAEFKSYVKAQVKEGELELDGVGLERSIRSLEKSLRSNGFDEKLELTRDLRNRISKAILDDMDGVKENVADGLEVAILSRELPDRLLVWRAVIDDQQVKEATKILRDAPRISAEASSGTNKRLASTSIGVSSSKAPVLAQSGRQAPPAEFKKTYDTVLKPPASAMSTAEGADTPRTDPE